MALIDKETIRAEIERRRNAAKYYDMSGGDAPIYDDLLAFLDTLPEQEDILLINKNEWEAQERFRKNKKFGQPLQQEQLVLPGIDEEGIPGKDFIPVEWADACERYGKWKIVQKVQLASVGLEEEIEIEADKMFFVNGWYEGDHHQPRLDISLEGFRDIARHFAEWGRKKVLQEIYDGKVKPVDKITAAWFDDEQNT